MHNQKSIETLLREHHTIPHRTAPEGAWDNIVTKIPSKMDYWGLGKYFVGTLLIFLSINPSITTNDIDHYETSIRSELLNENYAITVANSETQPIQKHPFVSSQDKHGLPNNINSKHLIFPLIPTSPPINISWVEKNIAQQASVPDAKISSAPISLNSSSHEMVSDSLLETAEEALAENTVDNSEEAEKENTDNNRLWYFGIHGEVSNTWLLNQQTMNGFDENELDRTLISLGSSFGIQAGTRISRSLILEADWHLSSGLNQSYERYKNGKFYTQDIKLTYTQLDILFIKNKKLGKNSRINTYIFAGPGIAYKTAHQENVTKGYKDGYSYDKFDTRLIVGLGAFFPITKKLEGDIRMKVQKGLQNIRHHEGVPTQFMKTTSGQLSIQIGLNYKL